MQASPQSRAHKPLKCSYDGSFQKMCLLGGCRNLSSGQSKCKSKTSRRLHVEHKRSSPAPVFEALGRQRFLVPEATVHAACDMATKLLSRLFCRNKVGSKQWLLVQGELFEHLGMQVERRSFTDKALNPQSPKSQIPSPLNPTKQIPSGLSQRAGHRSKANGGRATHPYARAWCELAEFCSL